MQEGSFENESSLSENQNDAKLHGDVSSSKNSQKQSMMAKLNAILNKQNWTGKKQLVKCPMDDCLKDFSSKFCLKRHFLNVHMGYKKYKCPICERQFAVKQYMQEHMNMHT